MLLTGAALLLLLDTQTPGMGQTPYTFGNTCCDQSSTETTWINPCDSCKGGASNYDNGFCQNNVGSVEAAGECSGGTGTYNVYYNEGNSCQQSGYNTCAQGDSCPASWIAGSWQYDPTDCAEAPPGCGGSGQSCSGTSSCCNNLFCVGSGTCQSCSSMQGASCTPSGGSYACGTVLCDGSCNAECSSSSQCWNNGVEGVCSGGCCQYGGGCAENAGDPCGSCGYLACDGLTCLDNDDCGGGGGGGGDPDCPLGECIFDDPVILNLDGTGFVLTDAQHGVPFDFLGNGSPQSVAWTTSGSKTGWLALDRNGNGRIDNGIELFSTLTPQPGSAASHLGLKALQMYDLPYYGGNHDGEIDAQDAIFSKLRVWVDTNHNGITDPGELLTMAQAGITAISTDYLFSNWTDQYGNRFTYRAHVTWSDPKHGSSSGQSLALDRAQWAYEVMLRWAALN